MMKPRPDSAGFHQIPDSGTAAFAVNAMMHPQAAAIFPNIDIHELVMFIILCYLVENVLGGPWLRGVGCFCARDGCTPRHGRN
jgi:hypothetical protein